MHHKFAVIDSSMVIMGSFNWTGQAVKYNQENIFFYEDKNIAAQYAKEFEHLWTTFNTVIDQKEALKAVMDFFFDTVGVDRVECRHDPRNPHSGMVMRKCGMKYEGTMRNSDRNNQGICDASWYALLRSER
jgi:phosphatidylserine/phosphatidylglycerophosphate/cardiolipin synthase-like enzyme